MPLLTVSDSRNVLAAWMDGQYWRRDSPSETLDSPGEMLDYLTDHGWSVADEPFTPVIRKTELSAARRDGYQDWEILEVVRCGRHPWVLKNIQQRRRQSFNPFHGYIASGVAMAILFCLPLALGWVFRPLRSSWHTS